jgi:hypothetical protein
MQDVVKVWPSKIIERAAIPVYFYGALKKGVQVTARNRFQMVEVSKAYKKRAI